METDAFVRTEDQDCYRNNQINDQPAVAMITNFIDSNHRQLVLEQYGILEAGVFAPIQFGYKNKTANVYFIDMLPDSIFSIQGVKNAKKNFISAVKHAEREGVKVVLLAASTKRLFGNGQELIQLFPNIQFTIGDNGTAYSFLSQLDYLIQKVDLKYPIVVLGFGFLGNAAIQHLNAKGFQNIVLISKHKPKDLHSYLCFESLDAYINSRYFNHASLFLGCAHNHDVQTYQLEPLIKNKLIILDVAMPKSISESVLEPFKDLVDRFDGGNYDINNLHFDAYPYVGLSFQGELYGCFTEALLLGLSEEKLDGNFFEVHDSNIQKIKAIIQNNDHDFNVVLKNFGKKVDGYPDSVLNNFQNSFKKEELLEHVF